MSQLRETFLMQLQDLYDAEHRLLKALPQMAKAAEHAELKAALQDHLRQTKTHIKRLETIFKNLEERPQTKRCQAMQGLIEESNELIKEKMGDAALICAAQKIEHYEIATYGSLHVWARLLEQERTKSLLEETLAEEKISDGKLTWLAETGINFEESLAEEEEKSMAGAR